MNKSIRYLFVFFLLLLLIAVRFFEYRFFNDHLLDFFNYSYLTDALPEVSFYKVFSVISLRYWINTFLSILILRLLFPQKNLVQFLLILYAAAFVVLGLFFIYEWYHYQAGEYLYLFYVRRLLIQPVLLFILIPALLFHRLQKQ